MKTLTVTALSTEQAFKLGDPTQYYLVINGGELRIPVSEDAAQKVIEFLYKDVPSIPEKSLEETLEPRRSSVIQGNSQYLVEDEDGVAQV